MDEKNTVGKQPGTAAGESRRYRKRLVASRAIRPGVMWSALV